ncbi:MAG: glutamine--fructose-6-phosphate transaminase (isomerizing) [Actinomycetota bacterium]
MCGIVGYVGEDPAAPILLDALAALEYRGYDSAGVAVADSGRLLVTKKPGKVADLFEAAEKLDHQGTTGIGHTRWATCGAPTERNAHPHCDCTGRIAIAHNGIIENHGELRRRLEIEGHIFSSETDSETLAHLIEKHRADDPGLLEATRRAVSEVEGSLAIAVVDAEDTARIIGARVDSPLVVGLGKRAGFLASDVAALIAYTRRAMLIPDGSLVEVTAGEATVIDLDGNEVTPEETEVTWSRDAAEKGGYPDFMLKEIHEQPSAVRETLRGRYDRSGRIRLDETHISDDDLRSVDKVFVVACGSSYHAGLVAKYAIEHWTRLPVEIDVASEFRYRDPVLNASTLVVGISQSGETADTLAAIRYARSQGAKAIVITNVVGSSITRESDAVLYTHAGPEVGVAATKTLTTQMITLWLIALWLAQVHESIRTGEASEILEAIRALPEQMEEVLADDTQIRKVAERFYQAPTFLFIGRGVGFPVALEGALKLKEISYLHAEGFPAGEMKHGPIALIEKGVALVAVASRSRVRAKLLSNVDEARARGARVLAVAHPGDDAVAALAEEVLPVPETADMLSPLLDVLPLQLFAYHVAKLRGCDPDRPRNLAKSVTVE